MPPVVVHRRRSRQLLMLAVAVLFVLAAYDIVSAHVVSRPPETNDETAQLSSRGLSQRRTDYLWGSILMVAAVGLGIVSVAGLVRRTPVVEVGDDAIRLRVDGPNGFVTIPWSDVQWIHSGSDGEDELIPTRVLLVNVADQERYPSRLWGAEWDGTTLSVDADTWRTPPEELVLQAQLALDTWRRSTGDADSADRGISAADGQSADVPDVDVSAADIGAAPPDDDGDAPDWEGW